MWQHFSKPREHAGSHTWFRNLESRALGEPSGVRIEAQRLRQKTWGDAHSVSGGTVADVDLISEPED
eukprot:6361460-Pyramimonas_sp.AAC.1